VEIRGAVPEEPGPGEARGRQREWRRDGQGQRDGELDREWQDEPPGRADSVSYRVDRRLLAVKVAGAVVFLLAALAFHDDRPTLAFTGLATAVLVVYALRDVIAPVRLAADRDGVTVVSGYAGHDRLAWGEVERVRLDQRRRLGTRSNLLEIDAGERLYLLSSYDLNAHPQDVAEALDRLRQD
jgi:hypothetical protein